MPSSRRHRPGRSPPGTRARCREGRRPTSATRTARSAGPRVTASRRRRTPSSNSPGARSGRGGSSRGQGHAGARVAPLGECSTRPRRGPGRPRARPGHGASAAGARTTLAPRAPGPVEVADGRAAHPGGRGRVRTCDRSGVDLAVRVARSLYQRRQHRRRSRCHRGARLSPTVRTTPDSTGRHWPQQIISNSMAGAIVKFRPCGLRAVLVSSPSPSVLRHRLGARSCVRCSRKRPHGAGSGRQRLTSWTAAAGTSSTRG